MGIEPTPSAWKAEVLPLNYTRTNNTAFLKNDLLSKPFILRSSQIELLSLIQVEGGGFEPPKAEPPDLQSGPFDRSGTPPNLARHCALSQSQSQQLFTRNLLKKERIRYGRIFYNI